MLNVLIATSTIVLIFMCAGVYYACCAKKKVKIVNSDVSNVRKRPRGQEVDESEKTARQNGMTDVSIATASSSSIAIAPSIPIMPNMGRAAKRESSDARDEDEGPEKSQKMMSICVGQGAADKLGRLSAAEYKEDLE